LSFHRRAAVVARPQLDLAEVSSVGDDCRLSHRHRLNRRL
jgi:hypothetical protein